VTEGAKSVEGCFGLHDSIIPELLNHVNGRAIADPPGPERPASPRRGGGFRHPFRADRNAARLCAGSARGISMTRLQSDLWGWS
jgi:hypothetical protein